MMTKRNTPPQWIHDLQLAGSTQLSGATLAARWRVKQDKTLTRRLNQLEEEVNNPSRSRRLEEWLIGVCQLDQYRVARPSFPLDSTGGARLVTRMNPLQAGQRPELYVVDTTAISLQMLPTSQQLIGSVISNGFTVEAISLWQSNEQKMTAELNGSHFTFSIVQSGAYDILIKGSDHHICIPDVMIESTVTL